MDVTRCLVIDRVVVRVISSVELLVELVYIFKSFYVIAGTGGAAQSAFAVRRCIAWLDSYVGEGC